jgi:hypothetical protein
MPRDRVCRGEQQPPLANQPFAVPNDTANELLLVRLECP